VQWLQAAAIGLPATWESPGACFAGGVIRQFAGKPAQQAKSAL